MRKQKAEKKLDSTAFDSEKNNVSDGIDEVEVDDVEEPEAVDVGDTALIAIQNDVGNSTTVIRPQPGLQSGNTRRRIEDYMEMKRAARELHDLDDFDFDLKR
jgi:hypothetical protein